MVHRAEERLSLGIERLPERAPACWLLTRISRHDDSAGKSPTTIFASLYLRPVIRRLSSRPISHFPLKTNTSSSATRKIGGPPEEIATALAIVCLPPSDAAQAWRASMEGKWISAMRWKGGVPCGGADYFAGHNSCLAAKLLDGHGHMFVFIYRLEGFDVFGTRIDYDQPNASHLTL